MPTAMATPPDLLDKKEARIRRMFGQIAPWYDAMNHLLSMNIDRSWRRATVRRVPPVAGGGPVLDLCTGTGDLALGYARAADGPVVGADFCHEMLVRAVGKAERMGLKRVRFVEADAQQLPFPSDTFQVVSVAFGLRNVTDPDRGLAEMVRVAKPGGRVAVLEFSRPRGVIGWCYRAYFRHLLPLVGNLFARNRESAYRYLPESVLAFPDGEALAQKLRTHGLTDVTYTPLTFGVATLYVGRKPE
jgi:demethylmenaquinone methyltransferase / 2-methoxy-6-polyprenyl-1,4-benzoquinol methylase